MGIKDIINTIAIVFFTLSVFGQSESNVDTSKLPSIQTEQQKSELLIRFSLHEDWDINIGYEIAKEYLQRYPTDDNAKYLKLWVKAFEEGSSKFPNNLYKKAEYMSRWKNDNWEARSNFGRRKMTGIILTTNVLDDVENRLNRRQSIDTPKDIIPNPPKPAYLAPVDCLDTENCYNANAYSLALKLVENDRLKEIEKRLNNLRENPYLFGCYDIQDIGDKNIELRCRYVREIDINESKTIDETLKLPKAWKEQLKDQQIQKVWLENGIRIDLTGTPLEKPLLTSRPIALQTNTGTYVVLEIFNSDIQSHAGHVTSFKNKIFDISQCSNKEACVNQVMSKFLEKIEAYFTKTPLSVRVLNNQEFPAGEYWLGKERVRSDVLGLPWHEISRYTVKWYGRDADVTLFDSGTGKGSKSRPYIYLMVDQTYWVAPNVSSRTYKDATSEQESRYVTSVNTAVRQALAEACRDLNGNMVNEVVDNQARNVCVIPRR
ncbi:MAG TPA: hypothetical protein VF556_16400 [Pyrinomonadaceae bacterium]|jgi:hypothetical protein